MQQSAPSEQAYKNVCKMIGMKRFFVMAVVAFVAVTASAQSERFEQRYNLLVSKFGPAGVGVETVLDNWEQVDSLNPKLLSARFHYYFTKAQSHEVVQKPSRKYLGMDPLLTLKDSTGADMYYFQETMYDDELYGQAVKAADKAVKAHPEMLDFRFLKANAYIAYEKESPDMATAYLLSLIDEDLARKGDWTYEGEPADADFFKEAILEYCVSFYTIGSATAMKAFLTISEKMNDLNPKHPAFLNNIATYHLVALKDYKTALKYYNKVLKLHPDDYTAIRNCVILARQQKNIKLEKKYLVMLQEHGTESDRMSAKARLESLGK